VTADGFEIGTLATPVELLVETFDASERWNGQNASGRRAAIRSNLTSKEETENRSTPDARFRLASLDSRQAEAAEYLGCDTGSGPLVEPPRLAR
jgi:hypothetical protein